MATNRTKQETAALLQLLAFAPSITTSNAGQLITITDQGSGQQVTIPIAPASTSRSSFGAIR